MKKKTLILLSVILALILLISIGLTVIFVPRKITKLIDVNTIESVEFQYFLPEEKPDKILTKSEIEDFKKILSDTQYKIRLSDTRCSGSIRIKIRCSDVDIVLKTYFVTITDQKDGKILRKEKIYCDLTRFLEF